MPNINVIDTRLDNLIVYKEMVTRYRKGYVGNGLSCRSYFSDKEVRVVNSDVQLTQPNLLTEN